MFDNPAVLEKFVLKILGAMIIIGTIILYRIIKNKKKEDLRLFRNTYIISFLIKLYCLFQASLWSF